MHGPSSRSRRSDLQIQSATTLASMSKAMLRDARFPDENSLVPQYCLLCYPSLEKLIIINTVPEEASDNFLFPFTL